MQAFVDAVALPRLTRFVPGPTIVTTMEVDVPPLAAAPGSPAETLALRLTRSNRTIAVSFATEAGHFQAAGLPTVVCGPGSIDQAHKPDEFVDEAQLAACLAFLERLAEDSGALTARLRATRFAHFPWRPCEPDAAERMKGACQRRGGRLGRLHESERARKSAGGVGSLRILQLFLERLAVLGLG